MNIKQNGTTCCISYTRIVYDDEMRSKTIFCIFYTICRSDNVVITKVNVTSHTQIKEQTLTHTHTHTHAHTHSHTNTHTHKHTHKRRHTSISCYFTVREGGWSETLRIISAMLNLAFCS